MPLCQYKDIFGKPGEGFHKTRIFGLAAFDLLGTILMIMIISFAFKINIFDVSVAMIILFIFLHRLFCVDTALNVKLFGKVNE